MEVIVFFPCFLLPLSTYTIPSAPFSFISFLFCFFPYIHSLFLTEVLNSTLLHKSPPVTWQLAVAGFIILCWDSVEGYFATPEGSSAAGRLNSPPVFEKAPGDCGRKFLFSVVCHAPLAISFHFPSFPLSQQNGTSLFPSPAPSPLAELPFVISHTLSFSYSSLCDRRVSCCIKRGAAASSDLLSSLAVVYVTEARPVEGWSPDKREGLMIGMVARATHKHFRDVNKCVRAQRGAVFSGLAQRKCSVLSPCASNKSKHMHACTKKGRCVPLNVGA